MEWISVEDRLPEKEDYFLVSDGVGYPWRDFYSPINEMWLSELNHRSKVTHWMPLPKSPTE